VVLPEAAPLLVECCTKRQRSCSKPHYCSIPISWWRTFPIICTDSGGNTAHLSKRVPTESAQRLHRLTASGTLRRSAARQHRPGSHTHYPVAMEETVRPSPFFAFPVSFCSPLAFAQEGTRPMDQPDLSHNIARLVLQLGVILIVAKLGG